MAWTWASRNSAICGPERSSTTISISAWSLRGPGPPALPQRRRRRPDLPVEDELDVHRHLALARLGDDRPQLHRVVQRRRAQEADVEAGGDVRQRGPGK